MVAHYRTTVPCPSCGHSLDAATQLKGMARPKPGDLSTCFYCAAWLVFDQPPAVHVMTDAEIAALSDDEYEALRLVKQHVEMMRRRA